MLDFAERGEAGLSQEPNKKQGFWTRLFEEFGNPLYWHNADKSLLAFALMGPNLVAVHHLLGNAIKNRVVGTDPASDFTLYLASVLDFMGVGWVLAFASTLLFRKLRPHSVIPPYFVCALFAVNAGFASYAWGPTTSAVAGFLGVGGLVAGLLLFGRTPVMASGALLLTIMLGGDLLAYHEIIPYAPIYRTLIEGADATPIPNGRWLFYAWSAILMVTGIVFVLLAYIVSRMELREHQLEGARDQLSHAMDMIRRYVPAQLADQILAGRYSEGERYVRRTLTLFFSDIRGFTETADQLESEKLSELLNEYLTEMSDIAEHFGGTIDKFVGDAVVIFFGAPEPMEEKEQALRAVRMALAMQQRMGELSTKWFESGIQTPFEIRVGINTGAATVGDFGSEGRMDYTAIGTQVNLAARLESQCTPGKVLISHATWGLVHDEIPCTPRGEVQVKGIHYPVKVYEIEVPGKAL